jgi:hypothetical protein
MVRHLYVVGNYLDHQCLRDAVYLVALQNQDALNRGAVLTFRVVHQLHQLVFVVDAELNFHQLKMDCCQDVVDVELNFHQLKMDCYQDVALPVLLLLRQYFHLKFFLPLLGLMGAQRFLREQPLALLNQRQVQRLIQRLIQDLPQRSSSRQSSLQQLS